MLAGASTCWSLLGGATFSALQLSDRNATALPSTAGGDEHVAVSVGATAQCGIDTLAALRAHAAMAAESRGHVVTGSEQVECVAAATSAGRCATIGSLLLQD